MISRQSSPYFQIWSNIPLETCSLLTLRSPASGRTGGRRDDIIVFKPGYMCNPVKLEQYIAQHSEVRVALMTGTGRFQPALLIEPAGD